jgi:hypothetical protein
VSIATLIRTRLRSASFDPAAVSVHSRGIATAVAIARALAGASPVVIVFANAAYAALLANWIGFARASNILVIALDAEAQGVAAANGVASVLLPGTASRAELWILRALLFSEFARAGMDFIHSDVDAVWARSPVEEVRSLDVDIAFTSGTVWPREVARRWGFVVCCGFFAVRASPATASFFADVAKRAAACGDDQVAVNEALVAAGATWMPRARGEQRVYQGRPFQIFADTVFGDADGLRLALLPHRRFPRLPDPAADVVVAHPLGSPAKGVSGAECAARALATLGLWRPDGGVGQPVA